MRISWEQTGDEFPTRWDSNCVRLKDNGPLLFGRITAREPYDGFLLEVHKNAEGPSCHWEHCPTLAEAKRRGAEVLRALCGGSALKEATVWGVVCPKGKLLLWTVADTRAIAWGRADCANRKQGYTVRKFRIEEVR